MSFWQATLDTRNFSFEAYGARKSDALMALGDTLSRHAEQYDLQSDWCAEFMSDIEYREIELGMGFRDRLCLIPRDLLSRPDAFKGAKG